MRNSSDVSPGQWLRGIVPREASENSTDTRDNPEPQSNLDELIETIIEEEDTVETPAESDEWILHSLRHLNELCQTRRNSPVSAEQHLERARADFERARTVADAAGRRFEAFERGVGEGRLCLEQSVVRELGREEREEMQRKVDELVDGVQRSPNADSAGAMRSDGRSAEESTPPSAVSSLGSAMRSRHLLAPLDTRLMHAKSKRGMPTPSSMPRNTEAGMPSPQSLSRRRSGWDLHREFLSSSVSRLP